MGSVYPSSYKLTSLSTALQCLSLSELHQPGAEVRRVLCRSLCRSSVIASSLDCPDLLNGRTPITLKMLHQRLLLHSPAFLLLAAANLLLLVKSIYSEPTARALSLKDGLHAFHNASQSLLASEGPLDGTRRPDRHGASSASDLGDSLRSSQCRSASPGASTQSCDVCVVDPSNELCRTYGIDNIHLSRAYEGSGHRMRKFFEKALRGEAVKIGQAGARFGTRRSLSSLTAMALTVLSVAPSPSGMVFNPTRCGTFVGSRSSRSVSRLPRFSLRLSRPSGPSSSAGATLDLLTMIWICT